VIADLKEAQRTGNLPANSEMGNYPEVR